MNSRNSSTSCVAKCPSLVCYVLACGVAFFDLNLCRSSHILTLVHAAHGLPSTVFADVPAHGPNSKAKEISDLK